METSGAEMDTVFDKINDNLKLTSDWLQEHDREFVARMLEHAYSLGYIGGTYTDNEEEVFEFFDNPEELAVHLTASDLSWLNFKEKGCNRYTGNIMLVFGNGPGETMADYATSEFNENLSKYMEKFYG